MLVFAAKPGIAPRTRPVPSKFNRSAYWTVCVAFVALTLSRPAMAQAPTNAAKVEARERFNRGLHRFNQADNEGALLEFKQAFALAPHAQVLKNIGLVYAAMNQPVQAVEVFDRLLANPAGLDPQSIERVGIERQRQAALIAELEVTANATNGVVEIDGIEAGKLPLGHPLPVAKGSHVVSVVATGYVPLRKQVELSDTTRTRIHFELVPSDTALAHLDVSAKIPGIDIYLNGDHVGKTPLPASLAILPGRIHLAARRPGYREFAREMELGPGARGSVAVAPELDPEALHTNGGYLVLNISEPDAMVFIDGESRGPYTSPLQLVAGSHTLRVEHAEFFAAERAISVASRGTTQYEVELEPTPQKLEHYQSTVRRRSTLGWVTTTAGGVLTAASVGFLVYNNRAKSKREDDFDAQVARAAPGGDCDPTGVQASTCRTELSLALDNLHKARDRDVYGWVGLGVGGATLGIGLWLLLGNDDPKRYSPTPQSNQLSIQRITTAPILGPDVVGASVSGAF